ncbi:MAG TPA: DNA-directed RNA polymerase subunit omega [Firmicutes bacterium]|nr:DNA-directed RNA polymerase subunit omega [Bacillota bacterium]
MIFPSIDKLLNVVKSKYELVHIVANRSKQMHEYKNYQLEEKDYKSSKNIGRAMEELENGLIKVNNNDANL